MTDSKIDPKNTDISGVEAVENAETFSEEACEISPDQVGQNIAMVPLDEELEVASPNEPIVLDGGIENPELAEAQVNVEEQVVIFDIATPSTEELNSAIEQALQDDAAKDMSEVEPAAGEEEQSNVQANGQDLANIEPAAGDQGAGANGVSAGRGFGFQSSFEAQGVINLEDVGPIAPTALEYGVTYNEDRLFFEEDLPDLNPRFIDTMTEHQVYEDGSVRADAYIFGESANSTLTVTISGIPAGWNVTNEAYDGITPVGTGVYDAGAGTWTITTSASTYRGGPIFTPPADSDVDALDLTYAVVENDPTTGQTGTASVEFDVLVDAVADDPDVDGLDSAGAEGAALAVNITGLTGEEVNNGAGSDDGSESIVRYEVSGLPAGFTISAGTETAPGSGVYILTEAELSGLTVTPNDPNFSGSISLTATVFTTENTVTDTDFDFYNNDNQASDVFTLTWEPEADKPCLKVDDAYVKEDLSIFVPVEAQLADTDGSEYLTVTVEGIPGPWSFTGAGWVQTSPGTYEVTLAPGANYNGGFTVYPPADSDVDLNGITVRATSTELSNNDAQTVSDVINVFVDAVADTPNLDAKNTQGEEGTTIPLTINTSVNDVDGSEVIELVKIGNLPTGATLTAGTYDAVNNVWVLDPADLTGLGINVPNGVTGNIYLSVESVAYEQNTSGSEIDLTDNRASAFDTITICVEEDDVPEIKDNTSAVDETDMNPIDSVTSALTVNFGADTPGDVSGNGAYDIGSLTSNGVPIDVTYQADQPYGTGIVDTYIGKAGTTTIFTLYITGHGQYKFDLEGTIDHPDATDPNDYVTLDFGVTATDSEGDTTDAEIYIKVYDDGPVAADDTGVFNAVTKLYEGNALTNDTMSEDDVNTITQVTIGLTTHNVPTDGSDLTINGTDGVLTINNAGVYSYKLNSGKTSSNDQFTYTLKDGDGDIDKAVIKLDVDPPCIKDNTSAVDETDMNPIDSVTSALTVNFGADTPGDVSGNGTYDIGTLTSNGVPIDVTYQADQPYGTGVVDVYIGKAGTTTIFTLYITGHGQYKFDLEGTIDHPDATDPNDYVTLDFGVTATDSEGETANAEIHIKVYDDGPVAHDDFAGFKSTAGFHDGNVLANDELSEDDVNTVTQIKFGGVVVDVPTDGSDAIINGDHGVLRIDNTGDYRYTLDSSTFDTRTSALNPVAADASGNHSSFTKDGITVSIANSGSYDISWVNTADGSGLGIDNLNTNDSKKVWPTGEAFDLSFKEDVSKVSITIAELGDNNDDGRHGLDYVVTLADGTQVAGEQQFVPTEIINGNFTFTLNSADYGGQLIDSVEIKSVNGGQYCGASFLLNDVQAEYQSPACVTDNFEYVLTDGDGDSDTALNTIKVCFEKDDIPQIKDNTVTVDETNLSPTTFVSGNIAANYGDDGPGEITGNGQSSIGSITSEGVPVVVTYDVATNTYTGTAGAQIVFTMVVNQNGDYTFTLLGTLDHPDTTDHNDALFLDFGVTATDDDGDAMDAIIKVKVLDDGPVAVDDTGAYNAVADAYEGNALVNDTMSQDDDNTVTQINFGTTTVAVPANGTDVTIDGAFGTLTIDSSGDYSYALNSGATNTSDKFTYTLVDGDGDSDTAVIDLDIDPPVITDDTAKVDETDLSPTTFVSDSIAVNFGADTPGDVSGNGTYDVGAGLTSEGRTVSVTYDAATDTYTGTAGTESIFTLVISSNGAYTFTLLGTLDHPNTTDHNDALILDFGVTATDSEGETADAEIHIKVLDDGPVAHNDFGSFRSSLGSYSGNVLTNDDFSEDDVNTATQVKFGSIVVDVPTDGSDAIIDGDFGVLRIDNSGDYTYTINSDAFGSTPTSWTPLVADKFGYVLTDGDGDSDTAFLEIKTSDADADLIVGQNVNDDETSNVPHLVNGDEGVIEGGAGKDILVGDAGGSYVEHQTQDYNFVFVLDASGSMGRSDDPSSRISLLKSAVDNLVTDLSLYQNGEIVIHLVPFATCADIEATFTITDAGELADFRTYLYDISTGGYTNYEDPLQEAITWLEGSEPLDGNAITTTYFISDGAPNRYMDANGNVATGSSSRVVNEITGSDGSNEVADLQALNDEVIGIGISVGSNLSKLDIIDSGADATVIDDPNDLNVALANTAPIDRLNAAGDDVIEGGEGHDIIFGDVLFTDGLAADYGINTDDGAGWEVFERLENGDSTVDPAWSRGDTIEYIRANAEGLSEESFDAEGRERAGGNDTIYGGQGNDLIFGQEGDDLITGGQGNDVIYGGSGADTFIFEGLGDGVDTIKDFTAGEGDALDLHMLLGGYDALTDDIADFVIATEGGGDTTISVDHTGNGGAVELVQIAVLENVTGFDVNNDAIV